MGIRGFGGHRSCSPGPIGCTVDSFHDDNAIDQFPGGVVRCRVHHSADFRRIDWFFPNSTRWPSEHDLRLSDISLNHCPSLERVAAGLNRVSPEKFRVRCRGWSVAARCPGERELSDTSHPNLLGETRMMKRYWYFGMVNESNRVAYEGLIWC